MLRNGCGGRQLPDPIVLPVALRAITADYPHHHISPPIEAADATRSDHHAKMQEIGTGVEDAAIPTKQN